MDFKSIDIDCFIFRRSSAVEQLTVNQLVVGSIPTAGAKKTLSIRYLIGFFNPFLLTEKSTKIILWCICRAFVVHFSMQLAILSGGQQK